MKNPNIVQYPAWALPIAQFEPTDGFQRAEQAAMLRMIEKEGDALLYRTSALAHMTASSIIVSRDRKRTLMAFHRIYNSWAWTGGHADGDGDLKAVALREASEETGITGLRLLGEGIASLEILPVWCHIKRGEPVGSHLHLNASFLFEADESIPLRIAKEENSAVGWIEVDALEEFVSEPTMIPVYRRLLKRANDC